MHQSLPYSSTFSPRVHFLRKARSAKILLRTFYNAEISLYTVHNLGTQYMSMSCKIWTIVNFYLREPYNNIPLTIMCSCDQQDSASGADASECISTTNHAYLLDICCLCPTVHVRRLDVVAHALLPWAGWAVGPFIRDKVQIALWFLIFTIKLILESISMAMDYIGAGNRHPIGTDLRAGIISTLYL